MTNFRNSKRKILASNSSERNFTFAKQKMNTHKNKILKNFLFIIIFMLCTISTITALVFLIYSTAVTQIPSVAEKSTCYILNTTIYQKEDRFCLKASVSYNYGDALYIRFLKIPDNCDFFNPRGAKKELNSNYPEDTYIDCFIDGEHHNLVYSSIQYETKQPTGIIVLYLSLFVLFFAVSCASVIIFSFWNNKKSQYVSIDQL